MICEDCGESNKAGAQFCLFCGAYLEWQDSDAEGANEVTQQLPPVAKTAAPPTPPAAPPPASAPAAAAAAPAVRHVPQATPAPAPQPSQPVHQPTPVDLTPEQPVVTSVATRASNCPRCGRPIDPKRRFCGHCGEQFVKPGGDAPVTRPAQKRDTWWSRLWDSKDRVARRNYRRSLPPLYRWRRVIISILTIALVGGGLTALAYGSPKSFFKARYYDLRRSLVPVPGLQAEIIPPDGSAEGSTPAALVDQNAKPWLMAWTPTTQGSPCRETPTTPVINLTFASTRIREVTILPGLQEKNPNRPLQFRPKDIWIAYGNQCKDFTLENVGQQKIKLDTKQKVESIRIGVMTAYAPDSAEGSQQVLAFTEIYLRSRPPVN